MGCASSVAAAPLQPPSRLASQQPAATPTMLSAGPKPAAQGPQATSLGPQDTALGTRPTVVSLGPQTPSEQPPAAVATPVAAIPVPLPPLGKIEAHPTGGPCAAPSVPSSYAPPQGPSTRTGLSFLDKAISGAERSVAGGTGKTPGEWLEKAGSSLKAMSASVKDQMDEALRRSDNKQINALLDSAVTERMLENRYVPASVRQAADQVSRRQLQDAISSADPRQLKGALVAARRLKATAIPEFAAAVKKYQEVRKLPVGWDVSRMVLHREGDRMVAKVEITDPAVMAQLQRMLDLTHRKVYTRDRMGAAVPDRLELVGATLITNDDLWADFMTRREAVRQELEADPSDFVRYPTVTTATNADGADVDAALGTVAGEPVEAIASSLAGQFECPLLPEVNETFLFHGTNESAAKSITTADFRVNLAGANAGTLYGRGVYFAENASKSDEYSAPSASGLRHLILCRVVLGRAMYTDKQETDPRGCEEACVRGKYHSVLGDRKKCRGTFREFIVFDEEQIYPNFILSYRRVEGTIAAEEKAVCAVVVPPGCGPGTNLQITAPNGKALIVAVPPGTSPGQTFHVQY